MSKVKAESPAPDLKPISTHELLERALEVQRALEAVKPLYTEQEGLILELISRGFTSAPIGAGLTAHLVDNFVDKEGAPKLTSWKSCGIRRFDLDFTDETSAKRKERAK